MEKHDRLAKVQEKKKDIFAYLKKLGIATDKITDEELLLQTFIHKSFAADYKDIWHHNERLEFVGDGILGAIIDKLLFVDHPDMPESELTLYKIALVREEILAEVARDIKLDEMLFISKGEERTEGRKKDSILSDGLEALIGFVYLQLGHEEVEKFIQTHIYTTKLTHLKQSHIRSYKTMIQELVQKEHKTIPEYIDTPHDLDAKGNPMTYKSELYVLSEKKAEGIGTNKKKAQEEAAKVYYDTLIIE